MEPPPNPGRFTPGRADNRKDLLALDRAAVFLGGPQPPRDQRARMAHGPTAGSSTPPSASSRDASASVAPPTIIDTVFETEEQIVELQALLDRSHERLGVHASVILTPQRRLTARQVVTYLVGMKHLVVGTVTARGEPRVAPVDGHFLSGHFWFGTGAAAHRISDLRRKPAISACHLAGDDVGIVVHGRAALFGPDDPEGARLRAHSTAYYGSDPYTWPGGNAAWVRIDPTIMTTFAMDPSRFPG